MVWAGAVFRVLARMKKTKKWEGPNLTTTTPAWVPSQSGVLTVGQVLPGVPVSHRSEAFSRVPSFHPPHLHIHSGNSPGRRPDELLRQTTRAQPKTPRTRADTDRHGNTVFHAGRGRDLSSFAPRAEPSLTRTSGLLTPVSLRRQLPDCGAPARMEEIKNISLIVVPF